MKTKFLITLSLFLGLHLQSRAEDTDITEIDNVMYVSPQTVEAGAASNVITVRLKNKVGVAGFQFDLELPEWVTYNVEGIALCKERTDPDRFMTSAKQQTDGCMRVLSFAIQKNPETDRLWTYDGNDGDLVTIPVNVPKEAPAGTYTIRVLRQELGDPLSQVVGDCQEVLGMLTVLPAEERVVLDEASTVAPVASDGPVDVKVKRTIKANEWATICLPFDMSAEQLQAAFGDDVRLAEFLGVWEAQYENDEADYPQSIRVDFSSATALNANQPYIIKTGRDITSFTVDGVTVRPEEVYQSFGSQRRGTFAEFFGSYVANTVVEDGSLFIAQNKFWYSVGLTKSKAFRCNIALQYTLDYKNSGNARKAVVFNIDDTATAIGNIAVEGTPNGRVYSLSGVCLGTERDLNRLPKGIYVVGGKKVINKQYTER